MGVTIVERLKSPKRAAGSQTSETHKVLVWGAADIAAAELALYGWVDEYVTTLNGSQLPLNEIETEPIGVAPDGTLLIEGTVTYGTDGDANKRQPSYQFETSGGTQKITNSFQTLGAYTPTGKPAPDNQGAINVNKDSVDGVDIVVPVLSWSEKHFLPRSLVTPDYLVAVASITGRTNVDSFRTFGPGTVLFLGATGSADASDPVEVNFKFQGSPDVSGITIGNIGGINKPGWSYLWCKYADGTSNGSPVKTPIAVYVEQVYLPGDFSILGIPTGASL